MVMSEPTYGNGRPKGIDQALPSDNVDNGLFGQDILSVRQFNRDLLKYVCDVADEMRNMVNRFGKVNLLDGKILGNLFYKVTRAAMIGGVLEVGRGPEGGTVVSCTFGLPA